MEKTHAIMLVFACFCMFGNYYCYDIPAVLNTSLQQWLGSSYHEYQYQLNILYSVYSLPNIILPLVAGYFVDKLGPNVMIVTFSTLICIGSTIFAVGVMSKSFSIMVLGRLFFGLGGESLEVAVARIMTDWFQGNGLAMALGFNLSIARLATALNDNLTPYLEDKSSVVLAAWVGLAVCIMSFISSAIVLYLDRPSSRLKCGVKSYETQLLEYKIHVEENRELLREEKVSTSALSDCILDEEDNLNDLEEDPDETIHIEQINGLGVSFWTLCATTIALYGAVIPFFHICSDFFQQKWYPNNQKYAGFVMSIPDLISSIASPIFGILVDKLGYASTLIPISGLLLVISHCMFTFTIIDPIWTISIMGIAYTLFGATIWPCVPFLVGRHQIATAYGLVTASLNLALFVFPFVVAWVRNLHSDDFTFVQYFNIALSIIGVILSLFMRQYDKKHGNMLAKVHTHEKVLIYHDDEAASEVNGDADLESPSSKTTHLHQSSYLTRERSHDSSFIIQVVGEGISIQAPHTYKTHLLSAEHVT